jgi:hypothetical protein
MHLLDAERPASAQTISGIRLITRMTTAEYALVRDSDVFPTKTLERDDRPENDPAERGKLAMDDFSNPVLAL